MNGDTARLLPARDYKRIKAVSRDLVNAAGGAQRICTITRASPARLSEALAPQCTDRFLAVDQIADLEADCGEPIVTRELADMAGFDLVARETKATGTDCEQFGGIARKTGETLAILAEALKNGKFDGFEIPIIRKHLHELMDILHTVDAALDARIKVRAVS